MNFVAGRGTSRPSLFASTETFVHPYSSNFGDQRRMTRPVTSKCVFLVSFHASDTHDIFSVLKVLPRMRFLQLQLSLISCSFDTNRFSASGKCDTDPKRIGWRVFCYLYDAAHARCELAEFEMHRIVI